MNLSQRDLSNLFGQLGFNRQETDEAINDLMVRYGEEPFHLNSFFLGVLINLNKRVQSLEKELENTKESARQAQERG